MTEKYIKASECEKYFYEHLDDNGMIGAMNAIDEMPAADVQSIKHGWWIEEEPRVLKCSVCGEYAPMNYLGQNCIDSRYCPWCGTKMDSNAV